MSRPKIIALVAVSAISVWVALWLITHSRTVHSREDKAKAEISFWSQVVEHYRMDSGQYPTSADGLAQLVSEGYIRSMPKDPWGRPYQYSAPGNDGKLFVLWSL